jgi:hypothetical protein
MTMMRQLIAKYPGTCSVCGSAIERGDMVDYERRPRGAYIAHASNHGDINPRCAGAIARRQNPDHALAQRFDMDYEDQCRDACGLGGRHDRGI